MPILYSAVVNEKNIVGKFATCDGNFDEIVDQVILRIPTNVTKMTYHHGRYLLHYIIHSKRFYFCITDKTCQRSRAFLFLNEIKRKFDATQNDFTKTLANEMYRYNEDYGTIVIRNGELEELNSIGVDSSETILGQKQLLVENCHDMRYTTIYNVETSPQNILLTVEKKRVNYIIISAVIFAGFLTIFCFSPSVAIVVIILLLYIVTR